MLFIDTRADISSEEITALKQNISILNRKTNFLRLVLENMTLYFSNPKKVDKPKFIKGGELTQISLESNDYIKNKNLLDFFKKYPDSPVSAFVLSIMLKARRMPARKEQTKEAFPVEEAYELLYSRLKETEYVKKIKLGIDKL